MRTTLDLPDTLFHQTKKLAGERGVTFKEVVSDALRQLLAERAKKPAFRLVDASFKGNGLVQGLSASDWERVRELAYEGRGG